MNLHPETVGKRIFTLLLGDSEVMFVYCHKYLLFNLYNSFLTLKLLVYTR